MARPRRRVGGRSFKSGSSSRLFFAIFLVIGLGQLGGAVYLTQDTLGDIAAGVSADGRVVDVVASRDSDGDTSYRPRVQFITRDGKTVEFESSVGSNPPAFDVGEAVAVIYDPASPGDAHINTFFQLWFAPLLLGFMGAVFTAVGSLAVLPGRRTSATAGPAKAEPDQPPPANAVDRLSRD